MTDFELRIRSKRVPTTLFPEGEVRIWIGRAETKRETSTYAHRREVLRKIARRGQWEILRGIRDRQLTVEEVVRIADETGLDTLHLEVASPGDGEPLGAMAELFLASVDNERTRSNYATHLNRFVREAGEAMPWNRVGRHEINAHLDLLREQGLSANSRKTARISLSAFFTWLRDRDESMAEQEGRPARSGSHPVRKAKRVQTATTVFRWLLPEEIDQLRAAVIEPLRAQYLALAYTGMRIGEFVSRRPEEVILEGEAPRIQILPRDDWAPKGYPRYEHGVRDIPIHRGRLLPVLEEYRREWAGDRTFFVNPRSLEPWSEHVFREQLKRDCKAAGIAYGWNTEGGITPHTFRHTFGTWLARNDVQLKKIAQLMGDTVPTVDRYYSHFLPSDLDETLNRALP